jgi:two-component system OmpR family sensor kinase
MGRGASPFFWPWVAWALVCLAGMAMWPGEETVPYHLGYAGLAVAFGVDAWSAGRAYLTLGGFTLATGVILVQRAATGVIAWEETAEIPLMCLLMALMVWHVGRRHAALARVTELADRDREQALRRERIVRVTSHEMRTPLAIATGYLDLLRESDVSPHQSDDLGVVHDELDRVSRAADRLLRMIRFHEDVPTQALDLDALVHSLALRWGVVASRDWQVDTSAGLVACSEERLRACLDTLVENAVRYTTEGQPIRVFARLEGADLVVGVSDGGAGMSAEQVAAVNDHDERDGVGPLPTDPRSQTGLGLSLVREIVESRGGGIRAGTGPEGGAVVTLRLPQSPVVPRPSAALHDLVGLPRRAATRSELGLAGR